MLTLATWNVNSIRARLERFCAWAELMEPDVVCLQELKRDASDFPRAAIERAGYRAALHAQKGRNGVAILTRREPDEVVCGFDDGAPEDPQRRLIRVRLGDLWIVNLYAPAGGLDLGSEKYAYKLTWFERLERYVEGVLSEGRPTIVCGDFNVAPHDRDMARPGRWRRTPIADEEIRARHRAVTAGLVEAVRLHHPEVGGLYSWWGYQRDAFERNDGLLIDQIQMTPGLVDACRYSFVDREERAGERPSDHAPVVACFDIA
jgi:exodeoxyribonuclease-3